MEKQTTDPVTQEAVDKAYADAGAAFAVSHLPRERS
jgi:hypothetical protein